jgi:hypothetical protein
LVIDIHILFNRRHTSGRPTAGSLKTQIMVSGVINEISQMSLWKVDVNCTYKTILICISLSTCYNRSPRIHIVISLCHIPTLMEITMNLCIAIYMLSDIRVINWRMRWVEPVACVGEKREIHAGFGRGI